MSLPRLFLPQLLKCRSLASQNLKLRRNFSTTKKNHSSDSWFYMDNYHPSIHNKNQILFVKVFTGGLWYWILYHLWHEPEMVFGEFPYQEPSEWTNAELGIPPDDYEE